MKNFESYFVGFKAFAKVSNEMALLKMWCNNKKLKYEICSINVLNNFFFSTTNKDFIKW